MGGCDAGGNVNATRTPGSTCASVAYTIPASTSPADTHPSTVRTLSPETTRGARPSQIPAWVSAARPYFPAGTLSPASPIRVTPARSVACDTTSVEVAGTTTTSSLPGA